MIINNKLIVDSSIRPAELSAILKNSTFTDNKFILKDKEIVVTSESNIDKIYLTEIAEYIKKQVHSNIEFKISESLYLIYKGERTEHIIGNPERMFKYLFPQGLNKIISWIEDKLNIGEAKKFKKLLSRITIIVNTKNRLLYINSVLDFKRFISYIASTKKDKKIKAETFNAYIRRKKQTELNVLYFELRDKSPESLYEEIYLMLT